MYSLLWVVVETAWVVVEKAECWLELTHYFNTPMITQTANFLIGELLTSRSNSCVQTGCKDFYFYRFLRGTVYTCMCRPILYKMGRDSAVVNTVVWNILGQSVAILVARRLPKLSTRESRWPMHGCFTVRDSSILIVFHRKLLCVIKATEHVLSFFAG